MKNFMSVSFDCLPILFQGLYLTFYLSMVSVVGGITLGVIGGLCRQSKNFFFSGISRIYVVIFRGTPFLVQLYIIYFVLPSFGIKFTSIQAGIIALSFNSGAYITEIVRAGIEAIPKEQTQAAFSLGMTPSLVTQFIILPQVIRIIIPSLVGQLIILVKDSSIASIIGILEVTRVGRELTIAWGSPFIIYAWVGVLYFAICYPLYLVSVKIEKRLRLHFPSL